MCSQAAYTSNEFVDGTQTLANTFPTLFKTDNNKIFVVFLYIYIYIYMSLYSKCFILDCRS